MERADRIVHLLFGLRERLPLLGGLVLQLALYELLLIKQPAPRRRLLTVRCMQPLLRLLACATRRLAFGGRIQERVEKNLRRAQPALQRLLRARRGHEQCVE